MRSGTSFERAAAPLNVSARSVEHAARLLKLGDRRILVLVESGQLAVSAAGKAAGRRPKARRTVRRPSPGEVVLAMWAPPSRVEEATKLVESERTLLVASRPNPLSS